MQPDIHETISMRRTQLVDEVAGILRGYIAVWGDPDHRDAFDTWFDRARPPYMGLDDGMHRRPLLYEHAQDAVIGSAIIGQIDRVFFDDTGIGYEGHLDRSSPHFPRIVAELRRELLATSSGTMQHTAEFYEDGAFRTWILGELSLTKNPAEPRMPATHIVRSAQGARDVPRAEDRALESSETYEPNSGGEMDPQLMQAISQLLAAGYTAEQIMSAAQGTAAPAANSADTEPTAPPAQEDENTLSADAPPTGQAAPPTPTAALSALLQQLQRAQQASQRSAVEQEVERLRRELDTMRAERNAPPQTNPFDRPAPPVPHVRAEVSEPRAYAGRSAQDLMFADLVMRANRIPRSEDFLRIRNMRAARDAERDVGVFADPAVRSAMPFTRANEVATSTAVGGGDEWVSTAWSSQIWEQARHNRIIDALRSRGMRMEEVPQGAESIYILTEGADPTVYALSQKVDVNSTTNAPDTNVGVTRIGSGRVLLTPGELGMAVVWTDVLEEDSIVAVSSQYQQQITEKAEETIEQLFLNGDTATDANTNINVIDGTPGSGLNTPYYTASDGALKYALVTGSGTSRDGGTLDEDDFLLTWKLLPAVVRSKRQNIAFVIDPDTYSAALRIPSIKTDDVRREGATLSSGDIRPVYGVDVLLSGFMGLANSAGKISATPSNNTRGRILAVYSPFWAMGWKRRITIETDRDVLAGANIIVAKMRVGFKPRGAGAATATYNLTV